MAFEPLTGDHGRSSRRIAIQATVISVVVILTVLNLVISPSRPPVSQAATGPKTTAPPPTTLPASSVPAGAKAAAPSAQPAGGPAAAPVDSSAGGAAPSAGGGAAASGGGDAGGGATGPASGGDVGVSAGPADTTGDTVPAATGQPADAGSAAPAAPADAPASGDATAPQNPPSSAAPGTDEAEQQRVIALLHPQSTTASRPDTYQGVSADSIKIGVTLEDAQCGADVIAAVSAAGGALPTPSNYYQGTPTSHGQLVQQEKEAIDLLVHYFNDTAEEGAKNLSPKMAELMRKDWQGNEKPGGYYGRKIEYQIFDGGNPQPGCTEKAHAAGVAIADEYKGFAALTNYDGTQLDVCQAVAPKGVMHFGSLWEPDEVFQQTAPYCWTQFATGGTIVNQLASYVGTRLCSPNRPTADCDKNAEYSKDFKNTKRVFGLSHNSLVDAVQLAEDFKALAQQYNVKIASEYTYSTDVSRQADEGSNEMLRFKLAGVTSIIMLTDPIGPLFHTAAAAAQNYYPEYINSSYGFMDSSTVNRLYSQDEFAGSFGISQLGVPGGFGYNGDSAPWQAWNYYHKYWGEDAAKPEGERRKCEPHQPDGHGMDGQGCKAVQAMILTFYEFAPFVVGVVLAGPDLTPQNVTGGLQSVPETRVGGNGVTSDPRPVQIGAGPGKFGFVVDAVEWKYQRKNSNGDSDCPKATGDQYCTPLDENKAGYITYPDCERHYFLWPDQLSSGWADQGDKYCDHPWYPVFKDQAMTQVNPGYEGYTLKQFHPDGAPFPYTDPYADINGVGYKH